MRQTGDVVLEVLLVGGQVQHPHHVHPLPLVEDVVDAEFDIGEAGEGRLLGQDGHLLEPHARVGVLGVPLHRPVDRVVLVLVVLEHALLLRLLNFIKHSANNKSLRLLLEAIYILRIHLSLPPLIDVVNVIEQILPVS